MVLKNLLEGPHVAPAGKLQLLPQRSLYKAAHDMAFLRATDPWNKYTRRRETTRA